MPAKAILSEISRAKDQMIDANEYLRRAGTDTPVSYTHLDVYKRQGISSNIKTVKK